MIAPEGWEEISLDFLDDEKVVHVQPLGGWLFMFTENRIFVVKKKSRWKIFWERLQYRFGKERT